jgi:hypothetical protein
MFLSQDAPLHVVSTTAEGASYDGGELWLRDRQGGAQEVALSDGTTRTIELAKLPGPIEVGDWKLVVDELAPTGSAQHSLQLPVLQDWRDIPGLKDAVGSGMYTASVAIPADWLNANTDVMIDVGTVAGAMQLSVNGTLVTKQTTPGGTWSIRRLLHAGSNEISVRLDTTLLNRMAQLNSADPAASVMLTAAPSGLLGPVRLTPIALGRVRCGLRKHARGATDWRSNPRTCCPPAVVLKGTHGTRAALSQAPPAC